MKLKYRYPTQEEIPAEHRGFYVEAQGAYQLDAEGAASAEDVSHLQNRLTHAETELQQQRAEYEQTAAGHLAERQKLEARVAQLEKNRGLGAAPSLNGPRAETETNPFARESFNLTQQGQIVKADPAKAAKLQAAAKKTKATPAA
jgi:hypothetical protein